MGQLIPGGWTAEHTDALKTHIADGISYANAAIAINTQFGTRYTRASAIGKGNRAGIVAPKPEKKPKAPRKRTKSRSGEHHTVTRIVAANGNSNAMRVVQSVVTEYKLRCVELVPLNVSLIDLEEHHCRYPYGDGPIFFCGHPKAAGSSYCASHHHLCWERPRAPRQKHFWGAAA